VGKGQEPGYCGFWDLLIWGFRDLEIWKYVKHKEIPQSQNPEIRNEKK
jgi:hypothetical protein